MTLKEVKSILAKITFVKSCIDFGWKWQAKQTKEGFLIRTTFRRPDINTGEIGEGFGRWMFFSHDCSEDCVVKTAWVCCELIVKHELMESLIYNGVKIFDPHKTIEELSYSNNYSKSKSEYFISPAHTKRVLDFANSKQKNKLEKVYKNL